MDDGWRVCIAFGVLPRSLHSFRQALISALGSRLGDQVAVSSRRGFPRSSCTPPAPDRLMRPHKWRVRCSRGTTSARPSGRSSGARGSRSGGMRRTSRPPIPLPSGRLFTKPVGRERQASVTSGRPAREVWVELPSHDDVVHLAEHLAAQGWRVRPRRGTSSSGRTAKTTLRAWPGSSPVTAALMRIRPSGSGGSIYMHPGLAVAPLVAAFLDPGRLRVLRPALRAGRPGINMATRKKHTPEQVVRKLATADRNRPPRLVHDLDRRRARLGLYRPGIRPQPGSTGHR